MNLQSGYKPRRWVDKNNRSVDKSLLSFPRTFGTTLGYPDEFNFDAGLTMPNQNVPDERFGNPAYPNGCTAFTTTDVATDDDKLIYDPGFTYGETILMEGSPMGSPCTIEDSLRSATVYGLKAKDDPVAITHRRGLPFDVHPHDNLSWVQSFWSAMTLKQCSLSIGTPWFIEFTLAPGGIVNFLPDDFRTRNYTWHNWKLCGRKLINGKAYGIVKPWIGAQYGDKGFWYFSEDALNGLMSIQGSACMTNAHATSADALPIKLTVLQTLLSYYFRLAALLAKKAVS